MQNRSYYETLSLRNDGIEIEKLGATKYGLDRTFQHYEVFWKYVVAPTTERPNDPLQLKSRVDPLIYTIAIRSYTVFVRLVQAHEFLERVDKGNFGLGYLHWDAAIIFAGNAIQVFDEVVNLIEPPNKKREKYGKPTLSSLLEVEIRPFADSDSKWKQSRNNAIAYRNYLTHQGVFQIVTPNGQPYVMKSSEAKITSENSRDEFLPLPADYAIEHPEKFAPIASVGREILNETVECLNKGYERINKHVIDLPFAPKNRKHWGETPAPPRSNVGPSINSQMSGLTCPPPEEPGSAQRW